MSDEHYLDYLEDRPISSPPSPVGWCDSRPIARHSSETPSRSGVSWHGAYQPCGIVVLTVSGEGIRRIVSFGDPSLLPAFGFQPDQA